MKAVVYYNYGSPDVLKFEEIEKPAVADNQVLIKVRAASVNPLDWHFMRGTPYVVRLIMAGLLKPKDKRLGVDVAGQVEAVGRNVTQFKPGDEVFGVGGKGFAGGGFAEYVCAARDKLALKPANSSFEDAASVPVAALTALQGLRDKGRIQPGQKVVIDGASGGVGTFAVQIAKSFGAEVTAVCSTRKMDMVRSLGADHVIDYTREDFTSNNQRYDLIFAANGYHPISAYKRALSSQGKYVMAGGSLPQMFQALLLGPWISMVGRKKMGAVTAKSNPKDLIILKELIESGKVKPRIDRCYPLREVPEAFRYLKDGHAVGKIVIHVEESDE